MLTPRQWIGRAFLAIAIAATTAGYLSRHHPQPPSLRHGPDSEFLPQAYVWQRAWTDPVRSAVRTQGPAFSRLVVLAAQIDFIAGAPHVTRVAVDWQTLTATHTTIAAAIRIGTYAGPFQGTASETLCACIADVLAAARKAHLPLAEIQIDFDAATSRLADYRTWLTTARKTAAPIPITFTALPTWLNSPAFGPMARDAGYFVLQVHWLQHPRRLTDPLVLCDLAEARRAIDQAARFDIPFRVALPTYSYLAAYNPDGSFAALAAESAPPNWAPNKIVRRIAADPDQLAAFVNAFTRDRPIPMRGFIWYRLPVDSDCLNWSFPTLESVLAGKTPPPGKLTVTFKKSAENLYDIDLQNVGLQDIDPATAITLAWDDAALIAADGLDNFTITSQTSSSLELTAPQSNVQLKPHERRTIAWLRFNKETQLHAAILQNPSARAPLRPDAPAP